MRIRRFSWGSGARVALPRWRSVAMIELALVVIIIAVASASTLGLSQMLLAKVRLTEALNEMHAGVINVVEHYAVTGRALPTNALGRERGSEAGAAPEYERHLSAAAAFAAVAPSSAKTDDWDPARRESSAYYTRAGVVDGAVVAIGRVRGVDRPYRMSLSPAAGEGAGPVLLWTCGPAALPQGFKAVGARTPDDIETELQIFACRTRRPW